MFTNMADENSPGAFSKLYEAKRREMESFRFVAASSDKVPAFPKKININ